jgi:UDPglucose 6-dehydrogenase
LSASAYKVGVIGIWHLGSIYSACLADHGYSVVGVDRDKKRVSDLMSGQPPLFEPGLEELLRKNIEEKRLSYTTDLAEGVRGAAYVMLTFDTPVDDNDEVDLSEIFETAIQMSPYLDSGATVIVSSQVPVGTCEQIRSVIQKHRLSLEFDIACSPENLRLGQAIDVFNHPERIVIGADSPVTLDKVAQFWAPVGAPAVRMNLRSAEMTKHALNAFLATSISFANEIANLCDEVGADALKVAEALRSDSRIGPKARLLPGLGFAGGTLARDLKALKKLGDKHHYRANLINAVLKVNEQQNGLVIRNLKKVFGSLKGLTIGVLGLTYKAGTSTLRRSAALEIIRDLVHEGAVVKAHDPRADLGEIKQHREFEFLKDPYMAAKGADALVIITEWPEFRNLEFGLLKQAMRNPVLIDTKNMLDDAAMEGAGFTYFGVGRGK